MSVYLYFKDKTNIENCKKQILFCNVLVSFSLKKTNV